MRRALGIAALLVAVVTAGCAGPLGGISDEQLCEDATYGWNASAAAAYNVTEGGEYQAVYRINDTDTIELHRNDGLGNERPLRISAVQFRAANGTEYDCEAIGVRTTRRKTIVDLPASEGRVAYSASSTPKRFSTQRFVEGSHEVALPPGREVRNPLFGSVQPAGHEVVRDGDRLRIRWEEVESERIVVQYYLDRDVPLFVGLVAVAGVIALGGILYYYRLIRRLRERRREAGLDVDVDDDEFGRDPPPGMG